MPIEYDCPECRNRLRVLDEHAGQQAKCPTCSHVSIVPRSTSSTNDAADHLMSEESGDIENPFQAPPIRGQTGEYGFRPHRGGQILTIGILSLLCCNLLGIAAWLMANADLQMMDKGAMDSAGRELTVAGKVLGIISLVLCALMIVFQLILVAI